MLELLRECEDNKILTAVYNNRNAYDSFSVGYVLAVTEEEMLLARISPRGEFDVYAENALNELTNEIQLNPGGHHLPD